MRFTLVGERPSPRGPSRAVLFYTAVVAAVAVAIGIAAGGVAAQPSTPIDSGPDDGETDDDRIVPSEQVPFGIKAMYGDADLSNPSGGEGVTVAVVDSGVDTDHPDLEGRVTQCRDFTGDRVRNRCTDDNSHGTHVAGTVAADGGTDARGIYGIAPEAELYAYKACRDDGSCGADALANAIRTATDEGADVVVLSLGGNDEPRIRGATEYASERGVVVVAAAGNSGSDIGSILYPAALPNVVSVGAIGTRDGERIDARNYEVPAFSSRGVDEPFDEDAEERLEVAAPGRSVLSPVPGGDYGTKTGTSMAAPHVAGLAAKILAGTDGGMSPQELRAELRDRAPRYDVTAGRHARAGYDPAAGFGVATVSEPRAAFRVDPETPVSDEPFALSGAASRSDTRITEYAWDTTGDGSFDRGGERIELEREPGTHPITLRVTDAENATATVTRDLFVNDRPRITIDGPEEATVGENVTFEATVDNEFGDTDVRWTLPNGTAVDGDRLTRSFDSGEHTVVATVSDEFGATSTATMTVAVSDPIEEQGPTAGLVPAVLLALALVLVGLLARRDRPR